MFRDMRIYRRQKLWCLALCVEVSQISKPRVSDFGTGKGYVSLPDIPCHATLAQLYYTLSDSLCLQ